MGTRHNKEIKIRCFGDEYTILRFEHLQYMADTGIRLSLNTYIRLQLGLIEPATEPTDNI
ncbi:hypothetical protein [Nostoc sp.]|uniref:hypothetical protein n=1 Tax=Nostoc sp. TaxID=1180 RepID=UPI002FFD19F5